MEISTSRPDCEREKGRKGYVCLISRVAAVGGVLFRFDSAVVAGAIPFIKRHFALSATLLGWAVSAVALACGAAETGKVALAPTLPKPTFAGTPLDMRTPNREAYRGDGVPPPALLVPEGTRLLSRGCAVTCNAARVKPEELALVTDGNKQYSASAYLELAPGVRWVQIDLGTNTELYAVCIWRERCEQCVYRDTVVQVSAASVFDAGVTTLFNNDHDDSAGLGVGTDKEYYEDYFGRRIRCKGVRARFVRVTSNGNTSDPYNHFTEIEVYGK